MRNLIAMAASLLLAACAAMSGTPGSNSGGKLYLVPPGPAMERVRATELASKPERGSSLPPLSDREG